MDVSAENMMSAHVQKTLKTKNTRLRMLLIKVCEEIHMFAHGNSTHTSGNKRKRKYETDSCVKKLKAAHVFITYAHVQKTLKTKNTRLRML